MSVYDIKDHPDYKFRPGHVVVRVGGYEVTVLLFRMSVSLVLIGSLDSMIQTYQQFAFVNIYMCLVSKGQISSCLKQ